MAALRRYGFVFTIQYNLSDSPPEFQRKEKTLVTLAFESKDPEIKKRLDVLCRTFPFHTFIASMNNALRTLKPDVPVIGVIPLYQNLERWDQE